MRLPVPRRGPFLFQFTRRNTRELGTDSPVYRRIEEKRRSLARATEEWSSLLREMETNGETSDIRYETYYRAYLQARELEKRTDLELFNLRQGLSG